MLTQYCSHHRSSEQVRIEIVIQDAYRVLAFGFAEFGIVLLQHALDLGLESLVVTWNRKG